MIKLINSVLVFILEMAMLGSFAYFGFQKGSSMFIKYTSAIVLVAGAIFLWSYFAAPRSEHRLRMPYLAIFRLAMFLIASYLLYKCDRTKFAIVMVALSTATQMVSLFTERDD